MMDRAIAAFCLDPLAIGGLWLRGRTSPVRDLVMAALRGALPLPERRVQAGIGDEALYGGIDLALTLASGRAEQRPGLLDQASVLILPMAERAGAGLAARLALALDGGRHGLVAQDEAANGDEGLAPALADRMGICLDLGGLRMADVPDLTPDLARLAMARALLPIVALPDGMIAELVAASAALGCFSPRAVMASLAVARALAALAGRDMVLPEDLTDAAGLTLAHRATMMPQAPPEAEPEPEPQEQEQAEALPDAALMDILVDAVRAALPPDLLERLTHQRGKRPPSSGAGAGMARAGHRKGRPLPARSGRPQTPSQLDLVATLRAAAPWQAYRRAQVQDAPALLLHPGDLRIKRRAETADRVLIFALDASGSAAAARLAEAKGAVELFLAAAYAKRDHVALLSFRGQKAELLLPPTRSLAQTKQRLRGLPGGGGTPLAAGLQLALDTALRARKRGMTPTLALLTDGRANVALDGAPGRGAAERDALRLARLVRGAGLAALVLDVSMRPQPGLAELALQMGARYVPLPRAQAATLAGTLGAALAAG